MQDVGDDLLDVGVDRVEDQAPGAEGLAAVVVLDVRLAHRVQDAFLIGAEQDGLSVADRRGGDQALAFFEARGPFAVDLLADSAVDLVDALVAPGEDTLIVEVGVLVELIDHVLHEVGGLQRLDAVLRCRRRHERATAVHRRAQRPGDGEDAAVT
ncbi:hypothetical protein D9M71_640710 [compost metagenome]